LTGIKLLLLLLRLPCVNNIPLFTPAPPPSLLLRRTGTLG